MQMASIGASAVIFCNDDEKRVDQIAGDLQKFCKGLGDWGEGTAIREIQFWDSASLLKEFGIKVPDPTARNTGGVILETEDYDKTLSLMKQSGCTVREAGNCIVVDLVESQNIFFVIPRR